MIISIRRYRYQIVALFTLSYLICFAQGSAARQRVPDEIADIFRESCMRCHSERHASGGLNLTPASIVARMVEIPSTQSPQLSIISPGLPDNSYLMMKLAGSPSISGNRMPPGTPLSAEQTAAIRHWITGLDTESGTPPSSPITVRAFAGWKAGNSPTAEILGQDQILFNISHRFVPKVSEGYDQMYGIDGPALIMLSLGYSPVPNLMFRLGRSNADDTVELNARYRLLRETADIPLSLALQAGVNWATENSPEHDRYRNDAFSWIVQAIATVHVHDRYSVGTAPAILVNPNPLNSDEDPLVAIGLMGRVKITEKWSIIGDVVPIVSGFSSTRSAYGFYDSYNRYDAWSLGIERNIGVHVFQLLVTNSEGLAASRYLNGGDLDIGDGDIRLGFTINSVIGI